MSEPDESTGASPAPFLGALAIIVAIVIAIWLFNLFSGSELTDEQLIARATAGQNDALQRDDYADFRTYTCTPQLGTEADVLARQRDSKAKQGERFVDGVTDVRVDGDRATASVTYHFANAPDAKQTSDIPFAREDGAWKVCSTGPS
ncbi:lumazine-binding protein [Mycolicibacterium sp. 018/SC-01/001]|uniref:Rv0361 family membrane protein n=1 Tax=Mycolicibacterium sp. 018/SC-01/001 TaxID=2592069 RepID=UPI0011813267|nr:lumazine-binding protein [Mycolicibacterium sp. 018/SC-01/001]TRW77824.1 lumazine-binding protein [Mycolicibacterium sp. 018/SC-01/001]